MTDTNPPPPSPVAAGPDHMFPALTPAQIARIAAHGQTRQVERGEVLIEPGEHARRFFVVTAGHVEIMRPSGADEIVAVLGPGQFTGEINMLSGRRGFMRIRASEAGAVIDVDREQLLALLQTDSELSEVLLRAFILRRVEIVARGMGDVVLVGSSHSPGTLRIKEFLTRNGHPYAYSDLERDPGVQELLDRLHVGVEDVPILICRGDTLRNPSNQEIAACLGFNEAIDHTQVRDLVIVGAGPSGLAAAVYGASEGLDVLVLGRISHPTTCTRRIGRWPEHPISSKPASPGCSPSATSGPATSSAWRRRLARDRLPSPWCIRCSSSDTFAREDLGPPKRNVMYAS
jgi:thioredoxin reductase (NADPH)